MPATVVSGLSPRGGTVRSIEPSAVQEELLSLVMPTFNEAANVERTLAELILELDRERVPFEIVVVDDNSSDGTREILERMATLRPEIRIISRAMLGGFGRAIRTGLQVVRGEVVVVVMADSSDAPLDVVRYYRKILEGYDCVFGSRFRSGSVVENYPRGKLIANRIVNRAVQFLFWTRFNDLWPR
jgi:dolichol-phosphate mannosyltransferase